MSNKYHNAHEVVKGNPRVDGPYLDDVVADQERAYREFRNKNSAKAPVAQPELPLDESGDDD